MPPVTVIEHLLLHQKESPMASGRFTLLLNELILAANSFYTSSDPFALEVSLRQRSIRLLNRDLPAW